MLISLLFLVRRAMHLHYKLCLCLRLLLSLADNLRKKFVPRSGPTKRSTHQIWPLGTENLRYGSKQTYWQNGLMAKLYNKYSSWLCVMWGSGLGSYLPGKRLISDLAWRILSAMSCAVGSTSVWCSEIKYWANFCSCSRFICKSVSERIEQNDISYR